MGNMQRFCYKCRLGNKNSPGHQNKIHSFGCELKFWVCLSKHKTKEKIYSFPTFRNRIVFKER